MFGLDQRSQVESRNNRLYGLDWILPFRFAQRQNDDIAEIPRHARNDRVDDLFWMPYRNGCAMRGMTRKKQSEWLRHARHDMFKRMTVRGSCPTMTAGGCWCSRQQN